MNYQIEKGGNLMFKKALILAIIFSTLVLPVYAAKDVETKLAERNVIESLTTQPLNIDNKKKPSKKEVPKKQEAPKQEIPKKVEKDSAEPIGILTQDKTLSYTDENVNSFKSLLSTFYPSYARNTSFNPARNEELKTFANNYGVKIESTFSYLDYKCTFFITSQSIPAAKVSINMIENLFNIIDNTRAGGSDDVNGILLQNGYVNVILKDSTNSIYAIDQYSQYSKTHNSMIVTHRFDYPSK